MEVSEICQVYFSAGWNELTELMNCSVVLVEKLVFNVTHEEIGIARSHFSAHGDTIDLLVVVVGKRETI